ncbi:MAG TPA: 3-deoxy-manno-octulosonate cytidylyltransferase [Gemmataceae bacterium]|nr:3-deoxy-manno-octulosonate cytidylyltransferase [Gemmataceae bacterium]
MKTVVVIPARYGSSRLPGKPLLRQTGKYLVQHVYERASQVRGVDAVVVATDDSRIASAVQSFGGRAEMTCRDHASGTDRVAEAARHLEADCVVNLQGDEPLIEPASVETLIRVLAESLADMATLAAPLASAEQWRNPNCVKVVCDAAGQALYFSRSPIPFVRDAQPDFAARPPRFLQHLGVYAYRRRFLLSLADLPPHPLEMLEKLEQLRALAHGRRIQVGVVGHTTPGVDTYDDYLQFVAAWRRNRQSLAA